MRTLRFRMIVAVFVSVVCELLACIVLTTSTPGFWPSALKIGLTVIFNIPLALSIYSIIETIDRIRVYNQIRKIVSDMSGGDSIIETTIRGESLQIVCYEDAERIDMTCDDILPMSCKTFSAQWRFDLAERKVAVDLFAGDETKPVSTVCSPQQMLRRIELIAHHRKIEQSRTA